MQPTAFPSMFPTINPSDDLAIEDKDLERYAAAREKGDRSEYSHQREVAIPEEPHSENIKDCAASPNIPAEEIPNRKPVNESAKRVRKKSQRNEDGTFRKGHKSRSCFPSLHDIDELTKEQQRDYDYIYKELTERAKSRRPKKEPTPSFSSLIRLQQHGSERLKRKFFESITRNGDKSNDQKPVSVFGELSRPHFQVNRKSLDALPLPSTPRRLSNPVMTSNDTATAGRRQSLPAIVIRSEPTPASLPKKLANSDVAILRRLDEERIENIKAKLQRARSGWINVLSQVRNCHHLQSNE
jgi:hypothetical protein